MERYVTARSEQSDRPLAAVDRIQLWNTFNLVLRRLAEKLVVGEIHDEVVTVSDQMEWLLERLRTEPRFVFSELFPGGVTLRRLIATFLAVLELTRLKRLRLRQEEAFADIRGEAVSEPNSNSQWELRRTRASSRREQKAKKAAPFPAPPGARPRQRRRPPTGHHR